MTGVVNRREPANSADQALDQIDSKSGAHRGGRVAAVSCYLDLPSPASAASNSRSSKSG
jgi:hypothetical protein